MLRITHLLIALAFSGLLASTASFAGEAIVTEDIARYSSDATIPPAVREECELQSQLPIFVQKYSKKQKIDVTLQPDTLPKGTGRELKLQITGAVGGGGGAWSGPKMVRVAGALFEDGNKVAGFTGVRSSGGGAFGGYKGTCSIMGRCVKALGKDISRWLVNPTDGAKLGEAH
ncbi:MAG: hypothetical protein JSW10_04750 [Pseudomonadota bacterium]|nr:MAG: hypothetical protein JSW10_04750 [Pseudomonadota bacterium]